jgi:tetratricopeptide (TPR) repeat protein
VRRPAVRRPAVRRPVVRVAASGSVDKLLVKAEGLKRREQFKAAERILRQAQKSAPNDVRVLAALGNILYEQNKGAQALRYLEQAYRKDPRTTAGGLVTLGSLYYERNKVDQARKVYQQYLKYHPRGKHVQDVRSMLKNLTLN